MQTEVNAIVNDCLSDLQCSLDSVRYIITNGDAIERMTLFNPVTYEAIETDEQQGMIEAITDINISETSTDGSVNRYPGVAAVSDDLLDCVIRLNAAKHRLSLAVEELNRVGVDSNALRVAYRSAGFPRIHPLQAWRQINILDGVNLSSIGFTVGKSVEGIEKLSKSAVLARLSSCRADDVIEQINGIPDDHEIHWHEPVANHIRANLVWRDGTHRITQQLYASMPFLIPKGFWPSKRVRFNIPRQHAKRSDIKGRQIISLPFLSGGYLTTSRASTHPQ